MADQRNNNLSDPVYKIVGTQPKEMGFGVRHIQVILMFVCIATAYILRITMSVAIVAMIDHESSPHPDIPVFDWDKRIQGFMLSSFFWGYLFMQIPGSYIAHKFGAKLLLGYVMLGSGALALLMPFAAQYAGWKMACVCRGLQGITQGPLYPCLHSLQGKWFPLNERGRLSTYIYGGVNFGTIVAMIFSGLLAATSFGWPIIFYCSGTLSIIIGIIWCIFGADSPETDTRISEEEKNYILVSLDRGANFKPLKIPWAQILKHMPVWALVITQMGNVWIAVTLFTNIPTYLNNVMEVNIKANGLLSALPFMGMWVFSFIVSNVSDRTINKEYVSLTFARKFANTVATCGACGGLLILSYVPAKQLCLAVIMLILTVSIKAAVYVGYHVNHIDISPNFSGTLMGICNFFSQGFGSLAPMTAGLIIHDEKDETQWRTVFFISIALLFGSNIFFLIFGSAEKAPWNEPDYNKNLGENKENSTELQELNAKEMKEIR